MKIFTSYETNPTDYEMARVERNNVQYIIR